MVGGGEHSKQQKEPIERVRRYTPDLFQDQERDQSGLREVREGKSSRRWGQKLMVWSLRGQIMTVKWGPLQRFELRSDMI